MRLVPGSLGGYEDPVVDVYGVRGALMPQHILLRAVPHAEEELGLGAAQGAQREKGEDDVDVHVDVEKALIYILKFLFYFPHAARRRRQTVHRLPWARPRAHLGRRKAIPCPRASTDGQMGTTARRRSALSGVATLWELCGTHHRAPPRRKNRARGRRAAWAGSVEAHGSCASYAPNGVVGGAVRGPLRAPEHGRRRDALMLQNCNIRPRPSCTHERVKD